MAQVFVSTYRNHYRGVTQKRVQPFKEPAIKDTLPDEDKNLWILVEDNCDDSENLAKGYAMIKELKRRKNRSTYQISYCGDQVSDQPKATDQDEGFDNQIILYCNKLYDRKIDKLLPPLPTSRQIFGYIRRSRLITPLTVYQNEYGRLACSILEKKEIIEA